MFVAQMRDGVMAVIKINVAKDFSPTPGGRYKKYGPASGEAFREKLALYLSAGDSVEVSLDGAEGYGSSFLEEAFGGLVRLRKWSLAQLKGLITIKADNPAYESYVHLAYKYMDEASAA